MPLETYETYELEGNVNSVEHLRQMRGMDVQRILDFYEEDQIPLFDDLPIKRFE